MQLMATNYKKKKNFVAKNLFSERYKPKIKKPKKVKGSFRRKKK